MIQRDFFMPLFDFICEKCATTEERLVRRDDIDKQICCVCADTMVKSDAVSKMSFQLKGVWYKTHKHY